MKCENIILLAGRPASGKTEMMIAYANQFPNSTLVLSEEYNQQSLVQRGLNHIIKVTSQDEFYKVNLENYKTLCIDYLELFDQNKIINIIETANEKKLRIILLSMMNRQCDINNILSNIDKSIST
ncbi:DnaB-like helicase C-terminal domain-containing protein [Aliarcobacter cryaerophilus]|uniref:DnaB-like helicase C-terminal domain-containing protein n=1 Tax=Aliarcobacter cryaerophilus TaxID=28198 RepID=UPI003DA3A965